MSIQLIKRSIRLFPRTEFANAEAVRHNRRAWPKAVEYLRCRPDGSKWILDQQVTRQ